jgi:hypothetical protein
MNILENIADQVKKLNFYVAKVFEDMSKSQLSEFFPTISEFDIFQDWEQTHSRDIDFFSMRVQSLSTFLSKIFDPHEVGELILKNYRYYAEQRAEHKDSWLWTKLYHEEFLKLLPLLKFMTPEQQSDLLKETDVQEGKRLVLTSITPSTLCETFHYYLEWPFLFTPEEAELLAAKLMTSLEPCFSRIKSSRHFIDKSKDPAFLRLIEEKMTHIEHQIHELVREVHRTIASERASSSAGIATSAPERRDALTVYAVQREEKVPRGCCSLG